MIAVDTSALMAILLEVAREQGCPLLFVGHDFAATDIEAALRPQRSDPA